MMALSKEIFNGGEVNVMLQRPVPLTQHPCTSMDYLTSFLQAGFPPCPFINYLKEAIMITFSVNGAPHSVHVPADMPLLWVLRDHLQLTGTKFGCGESLCGACTVHLDGRPVRSCSVETGSIEGRKIVTIEGINGPVIEALRATWSELDVPQCGYCHSGQRMQAAALLANNPKPDDADIDKAYAEALMQLTGDRGARDLLQSYATQFIPVACQYPGVLQDIDLPKQLGNR
jgi:isoquinoline 1-oxidoreductase alpha subunit